MNIEQIDAAILAAREFLRRAGEVKVEVKEYRAELGSAWERADVRGSRRTAALRRQSMELTRALADLRGRNHR